MKNHLLIAFAVLLPFFSFAQKDSIKAIPNMPIEFISVSGGYSESEIRNMLGPGIGDFNTSPGPALVITSQIPFDSANFGLLAVRLSYTHFSVTPIINAGTPWPPGSDLNTTYITSYSLMLGPYYSFHKKRFAIDTRLLFGFSSVTGQVPGDHSIRWFSLGLSTDLRLKISEKLAALLNLDFISSMIDGTIGICYSLNK